MRNAVNVLLIITAVITIILVLLQGGTTNSLSTMFSGSNSELSLFSEKKSFGLQKALKIATLASGITFFILVIVDKLI